MQTDWASQNLQVIRTLMERSAVYRRALAPVMGLVGATGLAAGAAGVALRLDSPRTFAAYWAAVAFLCLAGAFLLIRRQALKADEPFWSPPTRRISQAVTPPFLAGLAAALVFARLDTLPDHGGSLVLVAVWMVLYGLAMHAAGFFMPRGVRLFGWGYILAGLAGLIAISCNVIVTSGQNSLPEWISNLAMGLFFGGGHAAYGLYLHFTEQRDNQA